MLVDAEQTQCCGWLCLMMTMVFQQSSSISFFRSNVYIDSYISNLVIQPIPLFSIHIAVSCPKVVASMTACAVVRGVSSKGKGGEAA